MHIRKLSHCCLIIDIKGEKNVRILLDPGSYSLEKHRKIKDADIILITHEHADHFHIESLREILENRPDTTVITNDAVGEMLAKEGIPHRVMKHGNRVDMHGVNIEAYGKDHALMHSSIPPVSNIGFMISPEEGRAEGRRFFFPGDALTHPSGKVDVLALPVAGPWIKISESVDYALALMPKIAFPVHDAIRIPSQHRIPGDVLGRNGMKFVSLEDGGEIEIESKP